MLRRTVTVGIIATLFACAGCQGTKPSDQREPSQIASDSARNTPAYPTTLPSGEPFALRVLHQTYAPGAVKPNQVIRIVSNPLLQKFAIDNNLAPTQQELEDFAQALKRSKSGGDTSDRIIPASLASNFLLSWKIDRELYNKYGGAVIFQQMNPQEPVEAYGKYLRECEARGEFVIADEQLAETFWDYFEGPHRMVVPPEDVDFSTPWLLKMRKARDTQPDAAKPR